MRRQTAVCGHRVRVHRAGARGEAMFTQRGLPGRMIPIPSQVSAGCGLAWKAETSEEQVLLDALRETGIGFETHALVELFD